MDIAHTVKKMIKARTGKDVTDNTSLRDLGIDSLDLLDFVLDVEKELGIKVDETSFVKIVTVHDVIKNLEKQVHEQK